MAQNSKTNLIIFAKEPVLGKVKTRLQRNLSAEKVLRIYKIFIELTLGLAANVKCDKVFNIRQSLILKGARKNTEHLQSCLCGLIQGKAL